MSVQPAPDLPYEERLERLKNLLGQWKAKRAAAQDAHGPTAGPGGDRQQLDDAGPRPAAVMEPGAIR